MLRLLPPICRDCGVSSQTRALSAWLDFKLCSACIAKRERAVAVEAGAKASAGSASDSSGGFISEPRADSRPKKAPAAKKPSKSKAAPARKKSSTRPKKR